MNENSKSIIRTKHKSFELPAGGLSQPYILGYAFDVVELDPIRMGAFPRMLDITVWESLDKVVTREKEIEILLNAPYLRLKPGPGCTPLPWPSLEPGTCAELRALLKRGLYLCDAIADLEARAVYEIGVPSKHHSFVPDDKECHQSVAFTKLVNDCPQFHKLVRQDVVPVKTRRLQIVYIESLPDDDLCALYALCRIVTESWIEARMLHFGSRPFESSDDEDDDANQADDEDDDNRSLRIWREKEVALQETLLRHGSYFLYAEVRGHGARANHGRELARRSLKQSRDYMTGSLRINWEPGLQMTLKKELRDRFNVDIDNLERCVMNRVDDLIGATRPSFEGSTTV